MPSPKVAIVGRPNVGKSALFNRILGRRIAIVDEAEGVTRDRIEHPCDQLGHHFTLIDTGGIDPRSDDPFSGGIRSQSYAGIEEACLVVLVVDGKVGITELDLSLARELLKSGKPLALAVNKMDRSSDALKMWAFDKLGITASFSVSAVHGRGVMDLIEWICGRLPELSDENEPSHSTRLAIVGRANVGKSTLLNVITQRERSLVSDLAGTTRDSIDCALDVEGEPYTLIDTAGIRRVPKQKDVIEKFAHIRTERALERCDIALLVLDTLEGMTTQEKRIAASIEEKGRGCMLFLNKWDLARGMRMEHAIKALELEASFLRHCPIIVGSALQGRKVMDIFGWAKKIMQARAVRIGTSKLNSFVEKSIQLNHPPAIRGKRLRIYYLTQSDVNPPTFILFVNYKELLAESWKRYLINRFREEFGFIGLPVRFQVRDKSDKPASRGSTSERISERN